LTGLTWPSAPMIDVGQSELTCQNWTGLAIHAFVQPCAEEMGWSQPFREETSGAQPLLRSLEWPRHRQLHHCAHRGVDSVVCESLAASSSPSPVVASCHPILARHRFGCPSPRRTCRILPSCAECRCLWGLLEGAPGPCPEFEVVRPYWAGRRRPGGLCYERCWQSQSPAAPWTCHLRRRMTEAPLWLS